MHPSVFTGESPLITEELQGQLQPYLDKMNHKVVLKTFYDEDHDKSVEASNFYLAFAKLSDKIEVQFYRHGDNEQLWQDIHEDASLPVCAFYDASDRFLGVIFRGIPGGKEINSFLIALLTASGFPALQLPADQAEKLAQLEEPERIRIFVSLGCSHCSKMVEACQKVALASDKVVAEMVDAILYPDLIKKYQIERVPMTLIKDKIIMGEKSTEDIIDLLLNE